MMKYGWLLNITMFTRHDFDDVMQSGIKREHAHGSAPFGSIGGGKGRFIGTS